MTSGIDTKVFKSVDDIGRDAIDSLVDDGFFTYEWLKTMEVSKPPIDLDPFYVTAYDKGNLAAFTPCFRDIARQYFQYGPTVIPFMKRALKWVNRLRIGQEYVLLCYSPWCFRTKVFVAKNFDEKLVIQRISKQIDAICKKQRLFFSSFLFVSEFDKSLITNLECLGYHKFFWRSTVYLDILWRNFEDYVNSLRSRVRNNIKKELRCSVENGIIIEETKDFKSLSNTLSDLSLKLSLKYNKWSQRLEPFFFESLSDYAKDNTVVFVAKKKNNIVGFSLLIRKEETLDGFLAGFDYELQEKWDFTYFNVCYYAPIEWAIRQGIKKIYFRWGSEEPKYRRGCKPEKIFTFVKCQNRIVNYQISNYLRMKEKIGPNW